MKNHYEDIYNLLVDENFVDSDCDDDDGETVTSGETTLNSECSSDVQSLTHKRARRSRKKLDIPRTFKNDIRRSYSFMYANALNSMDCDLMTAFLGRFFVPGFVSTYHFLQPIDPANPQSLQTTGFASFLNMWFIGSLSAPDIVYIPSETQVRTKSDCSVVISSFTVRASKLYVTPPPLAVCDDTDLRLAVGKKRRLHLKPKSKSKLTSTGLLVRKERNNDLNDEDSQQPPSSFVDDIETTTISEFLPRPYVLTLTGTMTMYLDGDKRIRSVDYLANPSMARLELSEI
jgi:hypothetical protein